MISRIYGSGRPSAVAVVNWGSPQSKGLVGWWPSITPGKSTLGALGGMATRAASNANHADSFPDFGLSTFAEGSTDTSQPYTIGTTVTSRLGSEASISAWVKLIEATPAFSGNTGHPLHFGGGGGLASTYPYTDGIVYTSQFLNTRISFTPSSSVDRTQWHLLTITSSPSGWTCYQNTIAVATAGSDNPVTLTNPLIMGSIGGFNFKGWMVDVRIYNRCLTPADIYNMYNPETRWELYNRPVPIRSIKKITSSATAFPEYYYRMMRS